MISPTTKLLVALLEVNLSAIVESFVVDPLETPEVVEVIAMVGATLS